MTTTPTQAARVRSQVDHPIIDADGHFVELGPLLQDEVISYVEEPVARRARPLPRHRESFDTSSSLANRADAEVRRQWKAMPSWWGWQTAGVATAPRRTCPRSLRAPRRVRHRLHGPVPVDGPRSWRSSTPSCRGRVRAVNRYHARLFEPYRDADRRRADPDAKPRTPSTSCLRRARAGAKTVLFAGYARRPIEAGGYRLDLYGLDSDLDYDLFWATCVELGVSPVSHSALQQHRSRGRSRTTSTTTWTGCRRPRGIGQVVVPLRRHQRFPSLQIGFLEGGVAWACACSPLVGHWEKRNAARSATSTPTVSMWTR